MKKVQMAAMALIALTVCAVTASADAGKGKIDGKKEFMEHCSECHANGGNIVNPAKTLSKKDREANGARTVKDIIGKMRNPGPGMTKFDKKAITDKEARAIADYIIQTFK